MQGEAEDLKSSKDYFDNFRSLKDIIFKDLQNQFEKLFVYNHQKHHLCQ